MPFPVGCTVLPRRDVREHQLERPSLDVAAVQRVPRFEFFAARRRDQVEQLTDLGIVGRQHAVVLLAKHARLERALGHHTAPAWEPRRLDLHLSEPE